MEATVNTREEGTTGLLEELGLPAGHAGLALDLLGGVESRYMRDLKLNLKGVLKSAHIDAKGTALLALCIAANQGNTALTASFHKLAKENGANAEELAEAVACASLLSTNNVITRFRHFTGKDSYKQLRAGLRMNIMLSPATGKEFFELMSTAVSAVNGCQQCVSSHEASLMELGTSPERVFDAIRIAGVVVALDRVVR
ncbi:MAG: carboxymuconolactone decarboxylase family protein [Flavobacteriales bacterium]